MKIAVVNTFAPFIYGGAEYLADSLCQKLNEHGYKSMVIKIPLSWHPVERIPESILSSRLLSLANVDKVIALKFPAYNIKHPHKVVWLLHQFRQAYDLWGTAYQDIPNTVAGQSIRQMIINSDNNYLREAKKIYTNSKVTLDRLKKFNNIDAEVLSPPLLEPEKFYCNNYADYIFYPSRISHGKRQHLAIEAMRYTKTNVKLIIAGSPGNPEDLHLLNQTIEQYQLKNQVFILAQWISQQKKIDLMADCLGCVYIPYDEDSYGYVSLEAFYAKKTVVTCKDSGGVLDIVHHQETGLVTEPSAQELAQAFDHLYLNKKYAQSLGESAYELVKQLDITWENVLRKLVQ